MCENPFFIDKPHVSVYNSKCMNGGLNMAMAKKIRTVLIERDITIKELAEKIGTNGNNLSNKLSRDNFSEKELRDIAIALNCDYEGIFTLRDSGKKV